MHLCKDQWEKSYRRHENHVLYPKEETIRFISRYVRRRVGPHQFEEILLKDAELKTRVKGLDYGCGIGRATILMEEFGIEAYGLDIAERCIKTAQEMADDSGYPGLKERLRTSDGRSIPFDDQFFDITISEGSVDCTSFELALDLMKEIDRVTKQLVFITLYSGDTSDHHREFTGEILVSTAFSEGTIRNYFNWHKIQLLLQGTQLSIKDCYLITEESLVSRRKHGRYYVILEKG